MAGLAGSQPILQIRVGEQPQPPTVQAPVLQTEQLMEIFRREQFVGQEMAALDLHRPLQEQSRRRRRRRGVAERPSVAASWPAAGGGEGLGF
ncbi:hypothetical protein ACUV84_011235 [Puccinellia chinampoensis]